MLYSGSLELIHLTKLNQKSENKQTVDEDIFALGEHRSYLLSVVVALYRFSSFVPYKPSAFQTSNFIRSASSSTKLGGIRGFQNVHCSYTLIFVNRLVSYISCKAIL